MASLDRAFGLRGGLIACGMAAGAGLVHGALAGTDPALAAKLALAGAGFVVLTLAGVVSARRGLGSAIACAAAMLAMFLALRWGAWALVAQGVPGLAALAAAAPWAWPGHLAAQGAGWLALVETAAMAGAALTGCIVGHERRG